MHRRKIQVTTCSKCGKVNTLPETVVAAKGLCASCIQEKRRNYYNNYDFT